MKSGHPVSNEEERIGHISKRSVEEKIWIKENWNRTNYTRRLVVCFVHVVFLCL
jgi:hypothetical protein